MSDRVPWGTTLRQLLKSLHAIDEKFLDTEVVVSHASGGYSPISHTSVLYAGNPVIHLAEPKATEAVPDLWNASGDEVPAVNPDDIRKVWKMMRDVQARNAGQSSAVGSTIYKNVCGPGEGVVAVWYRASMLGMLQMLPGKPLTPWTHDGELADAVFQIASSFPMKKMEMGVAQDGPPFDVQEFLRQIGNATGQK